jgi:ribonuclease J
MDMYSGDLAFLPLGGTGEIGMNLNLYRCNGKWLAVDCGIGFGGSDNPEAEIMMPDPGFLAERRDRLVGLVITHAHEDHLGAVAHLWPKLRCPVYATPFASAVLRRKLGEAGLLNEVRIHTVPPGGTIDLAPFALQYLAVSHSIPESQALVIRTPHGTILHTGDWKLDRAPLIGAATDEAAFARLGEEGVLAMVCDSTNAMVDGTSGSEAEVRESLRDLVADLRGRVAVTCFASKVALVGRSLRNLEAAARECGYLQGIPRFLTEDATNSIEDDELLIIVTGSQGEPRSALARIAADTHQNIALGEGDTVIFSSRQIPGNERAILTVQDGLVRRGVRVITDDDHPVHVSGHPAREELRTLYRLVRPKFSVPTHGEWRHLSAHADLARACGVSPIMLEDGDVLSLAPGHPEVVDSAPVGRLVLDGNRVVPINGGVLSARRRMLFNGIVLGSFAVDGGGRLLGQAKVSAPGLFEPDDPESGRLAAEFGQAVADLPLGLRQDDSALTGAARAALRRALGRRLQKRPMVDVHLLRV